MDVHPNRRVLDVIKPAVHGTLSVLGSAKKHQDTVKRVVVTGSVASIIQYPLVPPAPAAWDETSFNDASIKAVEQGTVDPGIIYCASKAMAEKGHSIFFHRIASPLIYVYAHRGVGFHEGEGHIVV